METPKQPHVGTAQAQAKSSELSLDGLVKFGYVKREVEPIAGYKVTMHVVQQYEREQYVAFIPVEDANSESSARRIEAQKVPTLAYAITKLNGEEFITPEKKVELLTKLRQAGGTVIDLLYIEYNKLFAEQMELLTQGIKKK